MNKNHKKLLKYSSYFALFMYIFLNLAVVIQDNYYEKKLQAYDLNQDGFFTPEETTPSQASAQEKVVNDTARVFAPISLIPAALVSGAFFYFILLIFQKITKKKL